MKLIIDLIKCECGKKVLIERSVNGTNHTFRLNVFCEDCTKRIIKNSEFGDYPQKTINEIKEYFK